MKKKVVLTDQGKPGSRVVPIRRNEDAIPSNLLTLEKVGLARISTGVLPEDLWDMPRPKDRKGLALGNLLKERRGAG